VTDAGLSIDILVNNAGVGYYARFAEMDLDRHLEILRLNVVALTVLTRLFLEPMVARGHGRILNVSSIAAFQPTPTVALYGATKAFILSLTEALSIELEDTGVTATALCPGFTGTGLVENIANQAEAMGDNRIVPDFVVLDPAVVAREGVQACLAGRAVHINGAGYQALALWESWQPRWLIRSMGSALTRMLTAGRPY
jgi:short-subunit dehydrogenase